MRFIFLIFLCISLIPIEDTFAQQLYADSTYQQIQDERKSIRKKSRFKFSSKRHHKKIDFTKIDTNAVYIIGIPGNNNDTTFRFYRFFKDAVFQSGPYSSKPDSIQIESLSYGVWRCFKMDKKGLVIIETPKFSQMDSRWIFYCGTIYNNRIEFTHYYMSYPPVGSSAGYYEKPLVYYKQSVIFKNREYNWGN